ncbi:MAG: hypothetical protein EZS28_040525, partial [Streblomastix strix]
VGIADGSVRYGPNENPNKAGWENIVCYSSNGYVTHLGDWIDTNYQLVTGIRLALELNMDAKPRTLTFFVNDMELLDYVIDIPPSVRFWAYIFRSGSAFKLTQFDHLTSPTAVHGDGSFAWHWGKEWKHGQCCEIL